MKTSKEMQLKIIDKMRENIESGNPLFSGIELNIDCDWLPFNGLRDMNEHEFRLKPETITINGVEIPKPTEKKDWQHILFEPSSRKRMRRDVYQDSFHLYDDGALLYADAEEAIEASKLLFGIE